MIGFWFWERLKKRININVTRKYLLAYCCSNKVLFREKVFNKFVEKTNKKICHSLGNNFGKYPSTRHKISGKWYSKKLIDEYEFDIKKKYPWLGKKNG